MQNYPNDSDLEKRLDAWAASQSSTDVSPELQRKLRNALRPSLAPVKPISSRTSLFLIFLVVFLGGAIGVSAMMSKTGLHLMTGAQIGAIAAILTACGTLLISKLAGEMIPGAKHVVPLSAILMLFGTGTFLGLALLFPWRASGDFVPEGWPCAVMEIAVALPAAAIFWLLARRGAVFVSPGIGTTLAGSAVALALIPLQSQCMFQQAPHLLVWHGGTALLLIRLGAAIGNLRRAR
jgi:hypothetical protein